ncbi:hypothetical protein ACFE04_022954 [Oxalis oulophora]
MVLYNGSTPTGQHLDQFVALHLFTNVKVIVVVLESKEGLNEVVSNSWRQTLSNNLLQRLERCSTELGEWDFKEEGRVQVKLKELRSKLGQFQTTSTNEDNEACNEFKSAQAQYAPLEEQEHVKWKQRVQQGDMNTRYFHSQANECRKRNCVRELRNEEAD